MKTIDMNEIFGYLQTNEVVSVPILMKQFGLPYGMAKRILCNITECGWVSRETEGVEYGIIKKNLKKRVLKRKDVKSLCRDFTGDCSNAVDYLMTHFSATFSELENEINGDDDTKTAIAYLKRMGIIHEYGEKYFLDIDKNTASALVRFAQGNGSLRRHSLFSEESSEKDSEARLIDLLGLGEEDGDV